MVAYIKSISCISAQSSFQQDDMSTLNLNSSLIKYAFEPDYKLFVNAGNIRRLNRIIKMALVAGIDAVTRAKITNPEAIISGTGKGSLADTEKFLLSIFHDQERLLNPVNFINATYNALNGLIGLHYQVNSYCNMYVHRGLSCYSALSDAMLFLNENKCKHALVNVFDEMTSDHYYIKKRLGYWKLEPCHDNQLLTSQTLGTKAGEGATAIVLSSENNIENDFIKLELLTSKNNATAEIISLELSTLLKIHKPDLILCGYNGDIRFKVYGHIDHKETSIPIISWKPLSGEFETSDGFGIWLAHTILQKGYLDDKFAFLILNQSHVVPNKNKMIHRILIYNHFFGKDHVIYLMTK